MCYLQCVVALDALEVGGGMGQGVTQVAEVLENAGGVGEAIAETVFQGVLCFQKSSTQRTGVQKQS